MLAKLFFCSLGNTTVEWRAGSVAMQGDRTSEEGSENQSRLTEQIDRMFLMFIFKLPTISSIFPQSRLQKNVLYLYLIVMRNVSLVTSIEIPDPT